MFSTFLAVRFLQSGTFVLDFELASWEIKKQSRPSVARVKQVHSDFQESVAEVLLGGSMTHIRVSGGSCAVSLVEFCLVIWTWSSKTASLTLWEIL